MLITMLGSALISQGVLSDDELAVVMLIVGLLALVFTVSVVFICLYFAGKYLWEEYRDRKSDIYLRKLWGSKDVTDVYTSSVSSNVSESNIKSRDDV